MAKATPRNAPRPRRRRLLRRLVVVVGVLGVLCVVGAVTLWIVTGSWFITSRVEPVLGELLGGEVEIGHGAYRGDGWFEFRDVVLRVPGIAGPGGEVCRFGRARVQARIESILTGEAEIEDVKLSGVIVRLSEDFHEAGSFNFMLLKPQWSTSAEGGPALPPTIRIDRASVEMGVHDGSDYEMKGLRALSGSMSPVEGEEGWYDFTLAEVDERGEVLGEAGIVVKGRWNVGTNEHRFRIKKVELDDRAYAMCPQVAALWWERMKLAGRVSELQVRWTPGERYRIDGDVEDIGLTLPIETTNLWARYRDGEIETVRSRPRMHVNSGAIRITEKSVVLDKLRGELLSEDPEEESVGVPYNVTVEIDDIPALDWESKQAWMDAVLATAPFRMTFLADAFRVHSEGEERPPAVELPLAIARALERFHFRDWLLSTSIVVTREAPHRDESGQLVAREIVTDGQAFIRDASGTYENFRYPLEGIEAHLKFDNHRVLVSYLTGGSPGGGTIRLSGTIAPPTMEAAISLRLTASDIPVDEVLRGALRPAQQRVFDALLHKPSFAALSDAGLLVDEETVAQADRRRREAATERTRLREAVGDKTPEVTKEMARLTEELLRAQHLVQAGPFQLGGAVDFDLRIERPEGRHKRTITTGTVKIQSLGVIYERFPYPLSVLGGTLDWGEEAVVIVEDEAGRGLPFVTAGGARGMLTGRIDLARREGQTVLRPDLTLTIAGDVVNESLYAAIPLTREERAALPAGATWPGGALARSARWLDDFDLEGMLDFNAHITTDADDRLDYTVDIKLMEGRADPAPALAAVLGGEGLLEPEDWRLKECWGALRVSRDAVTLDRFTGRHRRGTVAIEGRIDPRHDPADMQLKVNLCQTQVADYLIKLLPASHVSAAETLWQRYQPHGLFDAELEYRREAGTVEPVIAHVRPGPIRIAVGDESVMLTPTAGQLLVGDRQVGFDELVVHVTGGHRDDGVIDLTGAYGIGEAQGIDATDVKGGWTDGHFQSPLIGEALRLFGAEDQARRYTAYQPKGSFDARFTYRSGRDGAQPSYELRAQPETVACQLNGSPLYFELDAPSEIVFSPGLIRLSELRGRHGADRFELSGCIVTSPDIEAELAFDYDGRLLSSQASAFLPQTVKDVLRTIDFQEGRPSRIRGAVLRCVQEKGEAGSDNAWEVDFSGRVTVQDASFKAGLTFDDVTGPFELNLSRTPGQPPVVDIQARPRAARAMGQHLTEVEASISLTEDGKEVLLSDFRARAQDGIATAEASLGLGERSEYTVSARLADVPLADFLLHSPAGDDEGAAQQQPDNRPSGRLFASLDLAGRHGLPQTRYGRGSGRVLDGELAGVPMVLQLLNLLQFSSPVDNLDYADVDFFIDGDRAVFERLLFESTQQKALLLELRGTGEVNLKTFEIVGRFHSRGAVPLVRDVVGGIGDQLVGIELTGPLWDPEARFVALPGIGKASSAMIGAAPLVEGEAD